MSGTVLALVLFGALLHAGWNSLIKAGADKAVEMALMRVAGLVLALPVVPMAPGSEPVERTWSAGEEELQAASPFAALASLKK